jgi:hypothetical protein
MPTEGIAKEATTLYHLHMKQKHIAKVLHMEADPVVQFYLAGLAVRRNELLVQLGFNQGGKPY